MKKVAILLGVLVMIFGFMSTANADSVNLFLDTAPNASGSPDWAPFRDAAYASIYNNVFVNQAHSFNATNIGTVKYEAEDYMVYSFGDLGKRLHAFYYIPGQTTASLDGRFQVSIEYYVKEDNT